MKLTQKAHRSEFENPGDYCITSPPSVILSCPFCGRVMSCSHQIIKENPLTINPSVVGPHNADQHEDCGHHFFVKEGDVKQV
jgi:hypothetical protein